MSDKIETITRLTSSLTMAVALENMLKNIGAEGAEALIAASKTSKLISREIQVIGEESAPGWMDRGIYADDKQP